MFGVVYGRFSIDYATRVRRTTVPVIGAPFTRNKNTNGKSRHVKLANATIVFRLGGGGRVGIFRKYVRGRSVKRVRRNLNRDRKSGDDGNGPGPTKRDPARRKRYTELYGFNIGPNRFCLDNERGSIATLFGVRTTIASSARQRITDRK